MTLPRDAISRLRRRWAFHPAAEYPERADLLLLTMLGLAIFSAGLGLKDPWPPDEPRFALIAQEMVETGDFFFPHRAGQLYADKPPIFLWSVAGVYAATGSMRLAHLLPSLVSSLITLFLVYDLGRRLWHRRAGLGAALALLAIFQFTLHSRTAQIDAMATMWTTLGLYGLLRHLKLGPDWRFWYLGCFAMGLGVITKGIGFLPLLILIPWAVAHRGSWPGLPRIGGGWRWAAGSLLLLAAIGLWLVPMLIQVAASDDPELAAYRNEILWSQTAERYTSIQGHQRPLLYYPLQAAPLLWLPLTLFLPWLLPAWWRRLRRRDPRYLMLLGWIALVMLFFTFSSGKRGVYILPAAPAFALAIGPLAAGLERLVGVRRTAFGFLLVLGSACLTLAAAGGLGVERVVELAAREGLRPWGLLTAVGLSALVPALWLRTRRAVAGLAVFLFCGWLLYGWWVYPLLNPMRSSQAFMDGVADYVGPFAELATIGWKEQLILHADRPVTHWGFVPDHVADLDRDQAQRQAHAASAWLTGTSESRWLLTSERWMEPCFAAENAHDLGVRHRRRWFLLDETALTGACGPGTDGWPEDPPPVYRTDWME